MLSEEHSLCHANKNVNISHPHENDLGEEIGLIWKTVTTSEKISGYAVCALMFFS